MFDYFKRNKASFLLKNNEAKAINPDSAELHSVPTSHFNKASEINLFDYFKRNKASFLLKNNEAKAIKTIVKYKKSSMLKPVRAGYEIYKFYS